MVIAWPCIVIEICRGGLRSKNYWIGFIRNINHPKLSCQYFACEQSIIHNITIMNIIQRIHASVSWKIGIAYIHKNNSTASNIASVYIYITILGFNGMRFDQLVEYCTVTWPEFIINGAGKCC